VNDSTWKEILDFSKKVWPFIEKQYGKYPYKQYSFIQGGDGGMEYPMATLITNGDLGTASHELMHSWFQGLLANNESLYAWLDEGFSNFSQSFALDNYIRQLPKDHKTRKFYENKFEGLPYPVKGNYNLYFSLVRSGKEEPLSTHADHFDSYYASLAAAYYKGAVFIEQLAYIVGKETRDRILIEYYKQWRFKHPTANDFIAIAEKHSNMKLDWYQQYWINTTKTIDYGIDSLWEEGGKSKIRLKRIGKIPMPVDLVIQYKDGSKEMAYVPMYLMFGAKPVEDPGIPTTVFPAWKWTHPTYTVEVSRKLADMKTLEIDESQRMADIERRNNKLEIPW
ncbi:MAG: M1 family aminopeptidase, partial [Flavitalea sp.]